MRLHTKAEQYPETFWCVGLYIKLLSLVVLTFLSYSLRVQSQNLSLLLQTANAVSITPDRLACGTGRLIALPRAQLVEALSVSRRSTTYLFLSVIQNCTEPPLAVNQKNESRPLKGYLHFK